MINGLSPSDLGILLGAILLAMSLHEMMHSFVAHWLGDTTAQEAGRLTLNPLKHIDIVTTVLLPVVLLAMRLPPFFAAKPVPFNPNRVKYDEFGAALVGVAGPLTNLVLAIATAGLIRMGAAVGTSLYNVLLLFLEVNVAFFVFNMIPFPPLDGSRLLYAFAPEPVQEIMQRIEQTGFTAIIFIMMLSFVVLSPVIIFANEHLVRLLIG